ncbi:MAG: methylcobamide:CoM methyltransferase MtaA [Methanosarcinaceae archaeon]|nr:methylcobamide:CoM methyltransferase MtaA [Methanosarcinaceae archaeon]
MKNSNLKDRFLDTLLGKGPDPGEKIPVLSVTQTGTVDLMKKTGAFWPEAHSNPEKMATLALAAHEITGLEAARYPYCVTVLSEALGCKVRKGSQALQPYVISHPLEVGKRVPEIPEDLLNRGRIPTVLEAGRLLKTKTGDSLPLIAGIESPASITTKLMGGDKYMKCLLKDPAYVRECLAVNTEIVIEYANALLDSGADAVCMPDGVSSPELLSPALFENFIKPVYGKFCREVNGIKIIHMCGDATPFLKTLSECGFAGISVEEKVRDLKRAKEEIGKGAILIGNVSTASTLLSGTPREVKAEAKSCLEGGIGILAPGCGIAPLTPVENMRALVEARNEYYS